MPQIIREPPSEPDVWLPSELDLEPEQCWCLRCGNELPCACLISYAAPDDSTLKEVER
jgi:hypothetical protein